jgi:D-hexose-6-phosphate mutarotase
MTIWGVTPQLINHGFARHSRWPLVAGLTSLARAALEVGLEDPAGFVKEASAAALKMLPQLGAEDFDVPQSIWQ